MKQWFIQLRTWIRQGLAFIHHELWEVELATVPQPRRILLRALRTAHLVIRSIKKDNIPLHASALTLGTLVSIVPVIAVMFSMYRGLGAREEDIEGMMGEWMEDMPAEFQEFVLQMLEQYSQVNLAALGGVFLVVVFIIVIKMLGSIEESFNQVWYITDSRNILRKISNYISILVIVPILVVAASAGTAVLDTFLGEQVETAAWIWRSLIRTGPLVAAWMAFTFLYVFVPNTQVRLGPGLISGLVGAVMWLIWQRLYIDLQIGVSKYNAIYGTFASVPIFLGWLYTSWIIILLGAEVAFSVQNSETQRLERTSSVASTQTRLVIAIGVMQQAAAAMVSGGRVFSASDFAKQAKTSIRLVNEIVRLFVRAGLLGSLADRPACYALLKAPEQVRVKDVIDTVLQDGANPAELGLEELQAATRKIMDTLDTGLEQNLEAMTLRDLAGMSA